MSVRGTNDAVRDVGHLEVLDEFDAALKGDVVLLGLPVGEPFWKSRTLAQIVDFDFVWVGNLHFGRLMKSGGMPVLPTIQTLVSFSYS